MKTPSISLCLGLTSYYDIFRNSTFLELTMGNAEQYLSLIAVIFIDGFFGIAAGIKREGFQTRKAVRVLKRAVTWVAILTVLLMVEKGFQEQLGLVK